MAEKIDIKQVVRDVLAGDQESFREIIKEYSPGIRVYLNGHLKDVHKVEDLCQETFMAVYWNLDSFDPQYSFKTWVYAIARNKLMSYFRSHYSQQKMMSELKQQVCELVDQEVVFDNEDNLVDQLKFCIEKQSEENLGLLKQRYFEKVSVIDIADKLETSVSAISSQLYRLRKQLKVCIERSLVS